MEADVGKAAIIRIKKIGRVEGTKAIRLPDERDRCNGRIEEGVNGKKKSVATVEGEGPWSNER
jgi:hypothetical protein